jgi:hypothetical protein
MWRKLLMGSVLSLSLGSPSAALDMNIKTDEADRLAYVNLWGRIVKGDDKSFRALVLPYVRAGYLIYQVNIFSRGGNVQAAMRIADQIRTLNARTQAPVNVQGRIECHFAERDGTRIVERVYTRGGPLGYDWCDCTSACFDIWASGLMRLGDYIGIHRFRYDEQYYGALTAEKARAMYVEEQKREEEYFKKLNVPRSIIDRMFAISSTSIYYLTAAEVQLMQATPYLEELIFARCGPGDGKTISQGGSRFHAYEARDKRCFNAVLKEFMRAGAKSYLAVGGIPPQL